MVRGQAARGSDSHLLRVLVVVVGPLIRRQSVAKSHPPPPQHIPTSHIESNKRNVESGEVREHVTIRSWSVKVPPFISYKHIPVRI